MREMALSVGFFSVTLCASPAEGQEEFGFAKGNSETPAKKLQEAEPSPFFEEQFRVPPNFENGSKKAQEMLEEAGLVFPEGAFAKYNRGVGRLIVVNTADQLDLVHAYLGCGMGNYQAYVLYLFLEQIEVDASLYHNWMFENRLTGDDTILRRQAQAWLKAGEASLLETVSLTGRSGQRSRVDAVEELIYTVGYDPHETPGKVVLEGSGLQSVVVPVVPAAFETRKLGTSLQLDTVLGADGSTLDVALSPESVQKIGTIDWPPAEGANITAAVLPLLHTMKFSTQVTLKSGQYRFLGTTRPSAPTVESRKQPLVMSFLRGDVGLMLSENPVGVRRPFSP